MTNREWLNSLSDEELIDKGLIKNIIPCNEQRQKNENPCKRFGLNCKACLLDWLKKERVEDERKMSIL